MPQPASNASSTLDQFPAPLRTAGVHRDLVAGERLFSLRERPHWMFYVLAGEVRLVRRSATGGEIILQRGRSGFIAEASLWASAYHCDGVAAEAGTALAFPREVFHAALHQDPQFQSAWMQHLASEVRRLRAQCERLSLHGAAERILHYIESEGRDGCLELKQTRKAWAAELALSHEALYRALSRLQAEGILVVARNRITRT